MPSILKIRVSCARDLPVMDRASELADAYAEVRFGDLDPQRSPIARKTLNPVWNHDFRLEIADDSVLQSEPLEIRVLDYDAITANDAVGSVLIDLDPLLGLDSSTAPGGAGSNGTSGPTATATAAATAGAGGSSEIRGWFPLYDTLRGIRGEVYVTVRLQFFGNANPFKDSSAGVQFFTSPQIPSCYHLTTLSGFVDAMLIDDDPEYHWTDSFRTPRSSNESRQKLLCRMSCQLRRIMGKKALELGANAIVGYQQCFDLENETKNIVARAIGTACLVTPVVAVAAGEGEGEAAGEDPGLVPLAAADPPTSLDPPVLGEQHDATRGGQDTGESTADASHKFTESPLDATAALVSPSLHSRPPQTPQRSTTLLPTIGLDDAGAFQPLPSPTMAPASSSAIAPMTPTTLLHNNHPTGATSAAPASSSSAAQPTGTRTPAPARRRRRRSLTHWLEHPILLTTLTRFPAHSIVNLAGLVTAKSVKLLSAYDSSPLATRDAWWTELRDEVRAHAKHLRCTHVLGYAESTAIHDDLIVLSATGTAANLDPGNTAAGVCRLTHVPYPARSTTLHAAPLATCAACGRRPVPPLVLATVDPPADFPASVGAGVLIEAHVLRAKKRKDGETNAALVSDAIPFAEFDLHRQLTAKLRAVGGNAVFGLKVQLALGDDHLVAVASGTAFRLPWMPGPEPPMPPATGPGLGAAGGSGSGLVRGDDGGTKTGKSDDSDSDSDSSTSSISVTGLALGLAGVPDSSYVPSVLHNGDDGGGSLDALAAPPASDPAMLGSIMYNCAPPAAHIPSPGPMYAHQIVVAVRQALLSTPAPPGTDAAPGGGPSGTNASKADPSAGPFGSFASGPASNRRSLSGAAASAAAAVAASAGGLLGGSGGPSSSASQSLSIPPPPAPATTVGGLASTPSTGDLFGSTGGGGAGTGGDRLAGIMNTLYTQTSLQFAMLRPCLLAGVSHDVSILDGGVLQVRMVGTVMGRVDIPPELAGLIGPPGGGGSSDWESASLLSASHMNGPTAVVAAGFGLGAGLGFGGTSGVEITPLASIPHTRITTYLGRLALHFVKEIAEHHHQSYVHHHAVSHPVPLTYSAPPGSAAASGPGSAWDPLLAGAVGADDVDAGGMGAFVQSTWTEIMAVVGAHVQALGGNALVAFRVEHSGFHDGLKNQMYALVCVSGDVCSVVPTAGVAAGLQ